MSKGSAFVWCFSISNDSCNYGFCYYEVFKMALHACTFDFSSVDVNVGKLGGCVCVEHHIVTAAS